MLKPGSMSGAVNGGMCVSAAVKEAIKSFDLAEFVFSLVPPKQSESSIIHEWGAPVKHDAREELGWICLGGQLMAKAKL